MLAGTLNHLSHEPDQCHGTPRITHGGVAEIMSNSKAPDRIAICLLLAISAFNFSSLHAAPLIGAMPKDHPNHAESSVQEFGEAIEALSRGDLVTAKRLFEKTWEKNPKSYASILYLAEIANRQGKDDEALKYLTKGEEQFPANPYVQLALGRYYFSHRDYDKAKYHLSSAVELDEQAVVPKIDLGTLYLQVFKDYDKAIALLSTAVEQNSGHPGAEYALAIAYGAKGSLEQADEHFERALQHAPEKSVQILDQMAKLKISHGQIGDAIKTYARLLEIQPGNYQAHVMQGDLFGKLGKTDEALKEYQRALELNPGYTPALLRKGMLLHGSGKMDEAEAIYRSLTKTHPDIPLPFNNLASLLLEQKRDPKEALSLARHAVDLMPQNPAFQDTLEKARSASSKAEP